MPNGPRIENASFTLQLPLEWVQTQTADEAQFAFTSSDGSALTVSKMDINVPEAQLRSVLEKFVEVRMRGEVQAAYPRRLRLLAIEFSAWGTTGQQVSYRGTDETGKYFYRFFGAVFPDKLVSVFCETKSSSDATNAKAFKSALEGLTLC